MIKEQIESAIAETKAWMIDGKPFLSIDEAKSYLFEKQLLAWFDEAFPDTGARGPRPHKVVLDKLIEDRYRLLTVFKTLNGGAQIALPPSRIHPSQEKP